MGKIDIYGQQKKVDWYLKRLREEPEFEEATKRELEEFINFCVSRGLSNHRVVFYMDRLYLIAKSLKKPFRQATREDLEGIVAGIQRNERISETTKNIYRLTIKYFYKYLEGNGEDYPDKVKWIKQTSGGRNKLLPEELLNGQDIQKMIDASQNPRDQALIAVLAESGCRVTEIASLRMKHVEFDEYGAKILVDGKTGMRKVRLVKSVHYLTQWIGLHPYKSDREAFMWVMMTWGRLQGKNMNYAAINTQIKKIAKRAGITKRVNLHGFRHARATELARMGLSGAQMAGNLGWAQSTKMAGTYIHLAGKDVDDALLQAYGIKKEKERPGAQKCPRCMQENAPDASFCKCGLPLKFNSEVFQRDKEKDEFIRKVGPLMKMLEDPDVQNYLAKKAVERG